MLNSVATSATCSLSISTARTFRGPRSGGQLPHLQLIGRQAEQLTELPQF